MCIRGVVGCISSPPWSEARSAGGTVGESVKRVRRMLLSMITVRPLDFCRPSPPRSRHCRTCATGARVHAGPPGSGTVRSRRGSMTMQGDRRRRVRRRPHRGSRRGLLDERARSRTTPWSSSIPRMDILDDRAAGRIPELVPGWWRLGTLASMLRPTRSTTGLGTGSCMGGAWFAEPSARAARPTSSWRIDVPSLRCRHLACEVDLRRRVVRLPDVPEGTPCTCSLDSITTRYVGEQNGRRSSHRLVPDRSTAERLSTPVVATLRRATRSPHFQEHLQAGHPVGDRRWLDRSGARSGAGRRMEAVFGLEQRPSR